MTNHIAFNPSGANFGSSSSADNNLGNGLNWPWSSDPIPKIPGVSGTPTIAQYEAYLDYLMNNSNSNTTYNGCIQMVQILISLGNSYSSMSPDDQKAFQKIVTNIQSGGGASVFANMINMIMMGSFYSNGASGFSATNAFCQGLVQELSSLNGISPFFAQMAEAATQEASYIQQTAEQNFVITLNGQTYLTDSSGNPVDFNHFVLNATGEIGNFITNAEIQQAVNNYYTVEAGSIFAKCKNPFEALLLLIMLLEGQGNDTNHSINGYGSQLNNLTAGQNLVNKIMGLLRKGNLQGPDAQNFMQQLNQLMAQVQAFDPSIASTIQQQIQSVLGQTGASVKSDGSGNIVLPGMGTGGYLSSTGAIYDFSNLPPGVTVYDNGVQVYPPTGNQTTPCYIPAGDKITLKGTASTTYNFSLSQLGSSDTVSGTPIISGLGDWSDIANYLNSPTNTQSLIQSFMSIQGTLNSPSSMINTQIQTETSQLSTENGFWKAGFDSFTNPIQTFNQNMQRAGE